MKKVKKRNVVLTDSQFDDLIDILVYANRLAKKEEASDYRNMIYYIKHDIIKYLITDHRDKLEINRCLDGEHKLFQIKIKDSTIFHIPYGVKYGLKFEEFEPIEYIKDFDRDLTCPYEITYIFKKLFEYYVYLNKGIENIKSGIIRYWYVNKIYQFDNQDKIVEIRRDKDKQSNNPGPNTEYGLYIDNNIAVKKIFSEFWDIAVNKYNEYFNVIKNE